MHIFDDLDRDTSLFLELHDLESCLFLDIRERFFSNGDFDLDKDDLEYSERLKLSYLLFFDFFLSSRISYFLFGIFYLLLILDVLMLRVRLLLLLLRILLFDFPLECLLFSFSLVNFDLVLVVSCVLFIKVDC